MNFTICIPTLNEELNINKCLNSIKWAKKIIILDSGSTDNTKKLVKKFTNTQFKKCPKDFDYVDKLNYFIKICKTEWILILDADYVVSKELSNEIRNLNFKNIEKKSIFGFKAKIYNKIFNQIINESIYPSKIFLFKKNKVRFIKYGHAEKIIFNKKVLLLKNNIYHENIKDIKKIKDWKNNQKKYSLKDAHRILKESFFNLRIQDKFRRLTPVNILIAFIYFFFIKKIFFYGEAGFFYLYQRMYYEIVLSINIIKLKFFKSIK